MFASINIYCGNGIYAPVPFAEAVQKQTEASRRYVDQWRKLGNDKYVDFLEETEYVRVTVDAVRVEVDRITAAQS